MTNATTRFLIWLLRLLLPARGRHRTACARLDACREDRPTLAPPRVPVRQPGLLRGEDSALVRPYVLTPDELHERRLQYRPRRSLWLAVPGVDAGPRWIHGVEVAA